MPLLRHHRRPRHILADLHHPLVCRRHRRQCGPHWRSLLPSHRRRRRRQHGPGPSRHRASPPAPTARTLPPCWRPWLVQILMDMPSPVGRARTVLRQPLHHYIVPRVRRLVSLSPAALERPTPTVLCHRPRVAASTAAIGESKPWCDWQAMAQQCCKAATRI